MFKIRIADINICIENKYEYVYRLCERFVLDNSEAYEMTVCADAEELQKEIESAEHPCSEAYAEAVVVYRKICEKLPCEYNGFVFHSALIEYEGAGYAFAARSGTGKSTHIALWQKHFGDGVRVINGDKPIVRLVGEDFLAYGTPWCGKEGQCENDSVPLKAICFITRGETNKIKKIAPGEAIGFVFTQILRPRDIKNADALFALLDEMLKKIPCYVLECNISENAAEVAYDGMKD